MRLDVRAGIDVTHCSHQLTTNLQKALRSKSAQADIHFSTIIEFHAAAGDSRQSQTKRVETLHYKKSRAFTSSAHFRCCKQRGFGGVGFWIHQDGERQSQQQRSIILSMGPSNRLIQTLYLLGETFLNPSSHSD